MGFRLASVKHGGVDFLALPLGARLVGFLTPLRGLFIFRFFSPTAYAVGFILPPLRGCTRLLHATAGHQEFGPWGIVEAADLNHGMAVGGGLDELAVTDVHAGVSDLGRRVAEEQKVSGLEVVALDRSDTFPGGLLVGVARHVDATGAQQHLSEAGAVEPEA